MNRFFKGIIVGLGGVAPGLSGSVLLIIFGLYQKTLDALGNLFRESMEEILASPRAKALYDGFSNRNAVEPLCRRCGFARRFG